jgi:probable phosphoglycerate mutase
MTLFALVRHAEIVRAFGDPGLTPRGEHQAAAVAEYLRNKAVECIYTSPLKRARQTAGIIAEILAAPLVVDARLRERINWGDTTGQTWEEFAAEWDRGDLDPTYIPRGGLR